MRLPSGNAWLAATALAALLTALVPHLLAPGYYFDDDVRHLFMASIHEIGNRLLLGEWPILTLRSALAGNLAGEGQLGLFNPVTLGLYAILSRIDDLGLGALIYASFHLVLMAAGVFCLARRMGLAAPYAALVAIAYSGTNFNSYWYASSWWNALTASTWLAWAAFGWLAVLDRKPMMMPVAVLASAAVLTAGWAHGSIALAVIVAAFGVIRLWRHPSGALAVSVALGGIAALLLSLPALVAVFSHVADGARDGGSIVHDGTMVASMDSLLAFNWPSFTSALKIFFNYRGSQPHFYCAWFILPLLLVHRQSIPGCWRADDGLFKASIILAIVFAFLSLGPTQLGVLRWPFRFVPYFHLFVLLAIGRLASVGQGRPVSAMLFAALWAVGFLLSWQQLPGYAVMHAVFAVLGLLLTILMAKGQSAESRARWLIAGTFAIFVVTHVSWPVNTAIGHYMTPTRARLESRPEKSLANVLVMQERWPDRTDDRLLFPTGNIGLWEGRSFVNGYSPVGPRGLYQQLCFNLWGWVCPNAVSRLLAVDPGTGQDLAALLRITEVRARKGVLETAMKDAGPARGFVLFESMAVGDIWRRDVQPLPGSLSWVSAGVRVQGIEEYSPQREVVQLENESTSAGRIVWARAAFPGYEATLDGHPLAIVPYRDMLASVEIPPGRKGRLELVYRLPGWRWTTPLALLGLVILGTCSRTRPQKAGGRDKAKSIPSPGAP